MYSFMTRRSMARTLIASPLAASRRCRKRSASASGSSCWRSLARSTSSRTSRPGAGTATSSKRSRTAASTRSARLVVSITIARLVSSSSTRWKNTLFCEKCHSRTPRLLRWKKSDSTSSNSSTWRASSVGAQQLLRLAVARAGQVGPVDQDQPHGNRGAAERSLLEYAAQLVTHSLHEGGLAQSGRPVEEEATERAALDAPTPLVGDDHAH